MNQANNTSETGSVNNGGMAPSSFTGDDGYKSFGIYPNVGGAGVGGTASRLRLEVL